MATIQERIKKLKEDGFFKEMQVTTIDDSDVIYVVVKFPERWAVDKNIEERYKITFDKGNENGEFYFCADMESGFDGIFDAIEYTINKMKSLEERAKLLREKVNELRELFEDENISLDDLKKLEFVFPKKESKKSLKDKNIPKNEIEQEIPTNNPDNENKKEND